MEPNHTTVRLAEIQDGGAQMRMEMSPTTVIEYAEEMTNGAVFPAVVVYGNGSGLWLADGFHRVEAAKKIGREEIAAEIHEGDARAAVLHGLGANASHGLRRTQADKRRAVMAVLADQEWSHWSNRQIAKAVRVDHKTVGKIRRELAGGEIPTSGNGKTFAAPRKSDREPGGSLVADLLKTISDKDLIAECQRRGLSHD